MSGARIVRFRAGAPRIPVARRWVSDVARQAGASADAVRIVELLTSEAVTNAVVHGPRNGRVDVEARVVDDRLRVRVSDESASVPVLQDPGATSLSGRGVMLIDRLADDWGVQRYGDAKTVWFEVAI